MKQAELIASIVVGDEERVTELYAESVYDTSVNWAVVNAAIQEKWSLTTLVRIKRRAWASRSAVDRLVEADG